MIQREPLSGQSAVRKQGVEHQPAVQLHLCQCCSMWDLRRYSLCCLSFPIWWVSVYGNPGICGQAQGKEVCSCWWPGLTQQHIDLCSVGTFKIQLPSGKFSESPAPSVRFLCILLKKTLKPTFRKCLCCFRSNEDPLPTKWCFCWSYIGKRWWK